MEGRRETQWPQRRAPGKGQGCRWSADQTAEMARASGGEAWGNSVQMHSTGLAGPSGLPGPGPVGQPLAGQTWGSRPVFLLSQSMEWRTEHRSTRRELQPSGTQADPRFCKLYTQSQAWNPPTPTPTSPPSWKHKVGVEAARKVS